MVLDSTAKASIGPTRAGLKPSGCEFAQLSQLRLVQKLMKNISVQIGNCKPLRSLKLGRAKLCKPKNFCLCPIFPLPVHPRIGILCGLPEKPIAECLGW